MAGGRPRTADTACCPPAAGIACVSLHRASMPHGFYVPQNRWPTAGYMVFGLACSGYPA